MEKSIDWKRVSQRLRCPFCGTPAYISPESDGTQGEHTHYFTISRDEAIKLSRLSVEEMKRNIAKVENELRRLKNDLAEEENS